MSAIKPFPAMVFAGAGLALGMASRRSTEALFSEVKAGDLTMLTFPSLAILGVALLAALRPVTHAVESNRHRCCVASRRFFSAVDRSLREACYVALVANRECASR
jgi:hypothetical protein